MKYTLKHILDTRYDANRGRERKLEERLIPLNVIVKFLSPYTTWFFLNIGAHPDHVTFLSLFAILVGSGLFITGFPLAGVIAFFVFGLLDSTDGDMARSTKPTSYGGVLDSFGADLFYTCAPVSIGYYLYVSSATVWNILPSQVFLVGAFVSLSFLFYRLVNAKAYKFMGAQKEKTTDYTKVSKDKIKSGLLKRFLTLYRHPLVRGNFFAEAGMIFWFFVLVVFGTNKLVAMYLVVLLAYNIGYVLMNFIGTYMFFRTYEANRIKEA